VVIVRRRSALAGLAVALTSRSRTSVAQEVSYAIDPASSQVLVHVGKTGLLRAFGHTHEIVAAPVHGVARVDPDRLDRAAVELSFATASLRVTGKDEPPDDVPKVQATMLGPKVLDADRYPVIRFASTSISDLGAAAGNRDVQIRGRLTLHGVEREIAIDARVRFERGRFAAAGTTTLRQSDFGITPVTVAGVVKVADELRLDWRMIGRGGP
jgi:polyisoprenoid-binding protein YceI